MQENAETQNSHNNQCRGHPGGAMTVIPTVIPSLCKTLVELVQNKMQIGT